MKAPFAIDGLHSSESSELVHSSRQRSDVSAMSLAPFCASVSCRGANQRAEILPLNSPNSRPSTHQHFRPELTRIDRALQRRKRLQASMSEACMARAERIGGQCAADRVVRRESRHADEQHRCERRAIGCPAARVDMLDEIEDRPQHALGRRDRFVGSRREVEALKGLIERERNVQDEASRLLRADARQHCRLSRGER